MNNYRKENLFYYNATSLLYKNIIIAIICFSLFRYVYSRNNMRKQLHYLD